MKELKILKELNVLYVDDDTSACDSLKHILQYYFKNVFIAYNGHEALKVYKQHSCHLLIVDYDMPVMNGYEFLSKIRENDETTSAFIMSSYDDKIKLKNAIKLNLLEYMTKPYELNELKNILKIFVEHIEKKGLLKYQITTNCYYNFITKTIIQNEEQYKLTSYEIKIFEYFLQNKNRIVNYDKLLDILESSSQKSLISIIYKLKKKLKIDIIKNVKDFGYVLKL